MDEDSDVRSVPSCSSRIPSKPFDPRAASRSRRPTCGKSTPAESGRVWASRRTTSRSLLSAVDRKVSTSLLQSARQGGSRPILPFRWKILS